MRHSLLFGKNHVCVVLAFFLNLHLMNMQKIRKMKRIILVLSLIVIPFFAYAQYQAEHVLEVKRFSNWAPEYLTVTNTWNNMCIEPQTSTLKCMSVVIEVDGMSTKDMEESDFYNAIDRKNSFELTYMTKKNGENKQFTQRFSKLQGKLMVTKVVPSEVPSTMQLLSDSDVDFFAINTFDYRLAGDDQLMDKTIMEVFANNLKEKGLKRVETNPDIYLYVTKNESQKIESIYVPQYVTQTTSGGASVGVANFLGVRGLNVGGSSGSAETVTKDVGGMKTNVQSDVFLEFSILDARKLNSDNPPVIWQLVYKEHSLTDIKVLESVKSWIGAYALEYPFHEGVMATGVDTWGVFCNNFTQDAKVSDVVPGSKADQMGCAKGDVIKYVRYADNDKNTCLFRPGQNFYSDLIIPTTVMMQVGKNKFNKGGLTERVNYIYIY